MRPAVSPKPARMTATPAGMTYADYLKLDQLLVGAAAAVGPARRDAVHRHPPDQGAVDEGDASRARLAIALVGEDRFAEAYKAMARISRIQAVMTLSWDVLSTLTPVDYMKFRHVLGTSSGFQSAQFREIEFRLGLKDPAFLEHYDEGRRSARG